jgi:5'-3' exoribonuclease 2
LKQIEITNFREDVERFIDDFIFMCFLVGNDFLPHLPMLNIATGGIDVLLYLYKNRINFYGGYLTIEGGLDLEKVNLLLKDLAKLE